MIVSVECEFGANVWMCLSMLVWMGVGLFGNVRLCVRVSV